MGAVSKPLLRGALLLALVAVAAAHGDDQGHGMPGMSMGAAGEQPDDGTGARTVSGAKLPSQYADYDQQLYDMPSYWGLTEHTGLLYAHIFLMLAAWLVVLPVSVMFSVARSRFTILTHLLFLAVNGLGIFLSIVYDAQTPDLYENNAHHKLGWVATWIAVAWACLGVVTIFSNRSKPRPTLQPMSTANMAEYQRLDEAQTPNTPGYRWSGDSGQGTERHTASLNASSRTNSWSSEHEQLASHKYQDDDVYDDDDVHAESEKRGFLRRVTADRFWSSGLSKLSLGKRTTAAVTVLYIFLERTIVLLGFMGLVTGFVTFGGVGRGSHVFNVLAHLIKGGIFIWYGILTFGRWLGCFADFGWAWNRKPGADVVGRGIAWIPSAEFTESFVICLYGGTNVFMEHMSNAGKPFSPMDLEHVSITILFFGGGLLGMLIESTRVRKLLNSSLSAPRGSRPSDWQDPDSYAHSLNPMPALVILLLGLMMSSHTQHSMISSMIHKQWGTLFVGFALSRAITYVTFWLKPPTSYVPTRPPSEIVASFCLISGGIIFMASNGDAIFAFEYFELDAMFGFTVTMGFTGLIMAAEVGLVVLKNWLVARQQRNQSAGGRAAASPA